MTRKALRKDFSSSNWNAQGVSFEFWLQAKEKEEVEAQSSEEKAEAENQGEVEGRTVTIQQQKLLTILVHIPPLNNRQVGLSQNEVSHSPT